MPNTQHTDSQQLQCMEIWGGNDAIDSAISIHGIDAWIVSEPHAGAEHGGDIHYVSTCGAGKIGRFAIADVAGHGAGVSALSSKLRALMRKHINRLDQTRIVQSLNQEFLQSSMDGRFASMVLASYYAPTDHLILVNAGHPTPLWYRADRSAWQFLEPNSAEHIDRVANLPLGVIDATDYEQFAVELAPNDLIVVYTDAVSEASDTHDKQLGQEGLLELVRSLDTREPAQFCQALITAVAHYRDNRPCDDDMTVMVLHHNAANPPPPVNLRNRQGNWQVSRFGTCIGYENLGITGLEGKLIRLHWP